MNIDRELCPTQLKAGGLILSRCDSCKYSYRDLYIFGDKWVCILCMQAIEKSKKSAQG